MSSIWTRTLRPYNPSPRPVLTYQDVVCIPKTDPLCPAGGYLLARRTFPSGAFEDIIYQIHVRRIQYRNSPKRRIYLRAGDDVRVVLEHRQRVFGVEVALAVEAMLTALWHYPVSPRAKQTALLYDPR